AVVIVISLASGGLAYTRYLCKRVRSNVSAVKLLVGLWGDAGRAQDSRDELAQVGVDGSTTDLVSTGQFLKAWQTSPAAAPSPHNGGQNSARQMHSDTSSPKEKRSWHKREKTKQT